MLYTYLQRHVFLLELKSWGYTSHSLARVKLGLLSFVTCGNSSFKEEIYRGSSVILVPLNFNHVSLLSVCLFVYITYKLYIG